MPLGLKSWIEKVLTGERRVTTVASGLAVVTLSDLGIVCTRPSGLVESVSWQDLKLVAIQTTDRGPGACDVFWLLAGDKSGGVVPQDSIGGEALLQRLQALPGFKNDEVMKAMKCADNNTFVCWQLDSPDSQTIPEE